MKLIYRQHPSNHELYINSEVNSENTKYAEAMLKHFTKGIGICSKKELQEFELFLELHGHEMELINDIAEVGEKPNEDTIKKVAEEIYNLRDYGNVIVFFDDRKNQFNLICDANGKRAIKNKIGTSYKGFTINYREQKTVEIEAL